MTANILANRQKVKIVGEAGANVAVADGYVLTSQSEAFVIAGDDGSAARFVRVSSDGTVRVDPTGTTTQPVRLTDGTDTADVLDLTNSNPLAVAIVDASGDQISSFGGGTQYTEGATDATITGTAMLWEDSGDTLRPVSSGTPLPVNIVAGSSSGVQYTEGDTDATITGTAILVEGAGNTLVVAPGTAAAGILVDLGSNNDVTVTGTVTANAGTNLNTSALALESGGNLAASATSLAVLDDWDESDRAKVNPISGQAGVQGGSGTVSANTQRVVLATDVGLPAGSSLIGSVRLSDGTDVADVLDLTNSNPLTVAIVDGSGDQITSFGGGVQYTEGATDASITGTAMLWEDTSDTLRPISAAKPLPVNIISGSSSGTEYTEGDTDATITGGAILWENAGNTLATVSASTPLPVNIISGSSSGTEYTEGATDASITGTAVMWEDAGDTLKAVSSSNPFPVNIVAGSSSGVQYTEGDTDATITGTALMLER